MHYRTTLAALAALALTLTLPAVVDAQELEFKVTETVPVGKKPAVILKSGVELKVVTLQLQRQDGKKITVKKKRVKAGETHFAFKQPKGRFRYEGKLLITAKDGRKAELPMAFQATVGELEQPTVSIIHQKSSLQARKAVLVSSTPTAKADIEVYVGNKVVHQDQMNLNAKAGRELVFTWPETDSPPSKIKIKLHDPTGRWIGQELTPFAVDIPHEEVVFDTGKATFQTSEGAKLDATLKSIRQELAKHGNALQMGLYVAGYTDTVGTPASNRALSERRARAIASYFLKKGLRIPVYCQGFGEDVLWVKTADNVDEARNRRAVYVLGNQAPPTSYHIPAARWKRVR